MKLRPDRSCRLLSLSPRPRWRQNARPRIAKVQAGGSVCPHCNLFQADLGNKVLRNRQSGRRAAAAQADVDVSLSAMDYSTVADADLRDVNGYGGRFTGVELLRRRHDQRNLRRGLPRGRQPAPRQALAGVNFSGSELAKAVGLTQGSA